MAPCLLDQALESLLGMGQGYVAAALLHALEELPCHAIGLPELLADPSAASPEAALVHLIAEARRASPAILYLPNLQLWWETAPTSLQATLQSLLDDLPISIPLPLYSNKYRFTSPPPPLRLSDLRPKSWRAPKFCR